MKANKALFYRKVCSETRNQNFYSDMSEVTNVHYVTFEWDILVAIFLFLVRSGKGSTHITKRTNINLDVSLHEMGGGEVDNDL